MLESLLEGFQLALRLDTFLMMSIGLALGIVVGALPGFTTTMALAILLPLSFFLDPLVGIPFLIGVAKGGIFGGSIPAILVSIPGTAASIATTFDGPALTKKGESRKAMEMALFASVFGDTASDILTILLIGPIAVLALKFGPPELGAVILLSLVVIAASSSGAFVKGLLMLAFGLFFGIIGQDPIGGVSRFTFELFPLRSGIPLLPMLIGVFALPEVFEAVERRSAALFNAKVPGPEGARLSFQELRRCFRSIVRSTGIGAAIGAIPGMGQVGNPQAITFANGHYPTQRLGQFGAWHTAIDDITVRAQTCHGPERGTPTQPQTRGRLGALGRLDRDDLVLPAERRNELPAAWHVFLQAIELNNQGGPGICWIAYVHRLIHGLHDRPIEQFERCWQETSANNVRDGVGRVVQRLEQGQLGDDYLGQTQETYDDLGNDPQCPLRTDQQTSQVGPRLVHHFSPHLDNIAVGQDHFEPQNVITGNTVLQTVHAARIGGDITANGRDDLAARVRDIRIAVAGLAQQLLEVLVDDAWLDHCHTVLQVDVEHPVHACHGDHQTAMGRNRRTANARARAACQVRHTVVLAPDDEARDVRRAVWKYHSQQLTPTEHGSIVAIDRALSPRRQDVVRSDNGPQFSDGLACIHDVMLPSEVYAFCQCIPITHRGEAPWQSR